MNVYRRGGVAGFWQGTSAKMVESASKGAVLLFAKEGILNSCQAAGFSPFVSGLLGGAGGGICQTVVMGPCTFIITALVTGSKDTTAMGTINKTWAEKGIKGFYPGGSAIAARQGSNWASRQGFTEFFRTKIAQWSHGDAKAKLSKGEEAMAGVMGGTISTWNQPFEVARIQMQAAAVEGKPALSMPTVMMNCVKENGVGGLFQGIVPRIGLGIWQTLFMVTGAKMLKDVIGY